MKKWIIVFFVFCFLLIASIYLFIPNTLIVSKTIIINSNQNAITRALSDEHQWANWWPVASANEASNEQQGFRYGSYRYQMQQQHYNILGVSIQKNRTNINSVIKVLALRTDTSLLQWKCSIATGFNPFSKVRKYSQAVQIKKNMTAILDHLQRYLNQPENAYGMTIYKTTVKDTVLIATRFQTTSYPSTEIIYAYINKLRTYLKELGARQTSYPMLHVTRISKDTLETMIAIPLDKEISGSGNFLFRRMVPGNILETQIKGGPGIVKNAFMQLDNYVQDHHLSSPAIPFESLITDRTKEPDTTKWITKIYYPIF